MIVASRIPGLTTRMQQATLQAIESRQSDTAEEAAQVSKIVEQIESLGYRVTIERRAA